MKPYHPDDSGLIPRDPRKPGGGNNNGMGSGLLSPFMPGQKSALANQMAFGFGGKPGGYKNYLQNVYRGIPQSFRFGGAGRGGNGGNGGGKDQEVFMGPAGPMIVGPNGNLIPLSTVTRGPNTVGR